jgi:hypothetical protein
MAEMVTISFPHADARALFAQIKRASTELGKSNRQAVKMGAWSVATTLGTSTRVAKKVRDVKPVSRSRRAGSKPFEVMAYRSSGGTHKFNVFARNLREAKKMPGARVRNYGLAKASWKWMIKKLGSGGGLGGIGKPGADEAQGRSGVTFNLGGPDPFIVLKNRVGYIVKALQGGPQSVTTAMSRAARYMEKVIDGNIRKKLGAK